MRLSCPSCQTEYDVPDAALTGRSRTLRCVNCAHQWQAGPIEPAIPEPVSPEPVIAEAELDYLRRPRLVADDATALRATVQSPPRTESEAVPRQFSEAAPREEFDATPRQEFDATPRQEFEVPPRQSFDAAPRQAYPPAATTETRPALRLDPAEARSQADRESFAALVEASRLNAQQEEPVLEKPRPARRSVSPWLVSILVLALLVAAIYLERVTIMRHWPPSIRLFQALHLVS